jgi:hypothetical protein
LKTYGQTLDTVQLEEFLAFFFTSNLALEEATGERPTPVCVRGAHGLGKTASVMAFARERGWKVAYCAPASSRRTETSTVCRRASTRTLNTTAINTRRILRPSGCRARRGRASCCSTT